MRFPIGLVRLAQKDPELALLLGVKWYFGCPMTQREIGACLDLSHQTIGNIEARAMAKLRVAVGAVSPSVRSVPDGGAA